LILSHEGKAPQIDRRAYVAPNATVCGDVKIGPGSRIMFGASVIAEGRDIVIGRDCIVMEGAVVRSTDRHRTQIGSHSLIGPNAHVVGCTLDSCVFVATGAAVFHGAKLGYGSEVRVGGVVHLCTVLPKGCVVPIGWVAVGNPARLFPPEQHEQIWAVQRTLDFPQFVYGVKRAAKGRSNMKEITRRRAVVLWRHKRDRIVGEGCFQRRTWKRSPSSN
jgi:carbonic anhydrase/acetyltransferase-like protein (isoleucine patch superfamily)